MKKIIISILFIVCGIVAAKAQTTSTIDPGTTAVNTGETVTVPFGFFVNDGTYTDTTAPGVMKIDGGVALSGTGTTRFYDVYFVNGGTSVLNSQASVYHTATINAGTTVNASTGNLWIRTDIPPHYTTANLVVNGILTGTVNGLVTYATATSGCSGYTSMLSTNISGAVVLYQWETSPDNSVWSPVSGATNATYLATVTAALYYRVRTTTTNSSFTNSTAGILHNVTLLPDDITGTRNVCVGSSTVLSDATPGGIWSASNGNASVGSTGIVSGLISGTVTITYSNGCSPAAAATVTVNAVPLISAGPGVITCTGLPTTLSASGGTTYTWAPGTGLSATTGPSVTATLTSGTTYTVTGTTAGCSGASTVTVSVNSTVPTITASGGTSFCSGTATLTASGGTTYTWAPPAGLSATTGSSVSATPASTTTYTVTGTTGGCSNRATVTLTLTGVTFDNGGSQTLPVCASSVPVPINRLLAASVSGGGFGTFNYTVVTAPAHGTLTGFPASAGAGIGSYPAGTNYQPTYGYTGSDVFAIRVSFGSCSVVTTVNVTVSGAMPAIITVTGGGGYCSGGTGVNVGISGSAIGISYQLYRGVTPVGSPVAGIGSAINFGLQTVGGTYTVMAINGSTGCMAPATGSATVTVYTVPTSYSVTGGGGYCAGRSGVHIGLSGSAGSTSYKLYSGGPALATITGTGSAIDFGLFTTAGTYTVTATSLTNGCVVPMTGSTVVSVNPNPTVTGSTYTVAPAGTIALTGSIGGGVWGSSATTVATIGSSSGIVTGVGLGTTVVTYTLSNTCYGTHFVYVATFGHRPSAGQSVGTVNLITVAPNPSSGTFTIKGLLDPDGEQNPQLQVTDMLGQRVYMNNVTVMNGAIDETVHLDGNLSNGMYIVTMQAGAATRTFHLSVLR